MTQTAPGPESEGTVLDSSAEPDFDCVFAALANADRRAILQHLRTAARSHGGMSITEIAAELEISRFSARHHLGILRTAGLIRIDVQKTRRISTLHTSVLAEAVDWLIPFADDVPGAQPRTGSDAVAASHALGRS